MDIDEIREAYHAGKYTVSHNCDLGPTLVRLPIDHIFDEDLSVRRNRELVEEHNQKVEEQRNIKRAKQIELDKKLTEDVVKYIEENYDLTTAQARIVEMWVYREKHSCMGDYFANIDTFAEFADDIANLKE